MAKFISYSCSPYGTTSIMTGSPNISISGGVATLTVAQTGNIGVGDNITFGSTSVYIAPNRLPFTSGGTTELKPGDRIAGATSGAKGIVRFVEVTSGSWSGGDAAGYIYFESIEGTFNSSEQLDRDRPSSSTNIATSNGALQGNISNGNTEFVVKGATGSDAADQTSVAVTSIHHEYASLSALEAGFTDANHLNSTDLTSAGADVCVFAACYYDHDAYNADANYIDIDFGTDDSDHYFHVFTPTGGAESVNNQRHDGKWNDNRYKFVASRRYYGIIENKQDNTKIEGIQCHNSYDSTTYLYHITNKATGDVDIRVSHCIIKGNSSVTSGNCLSSDGNTTGGSLKFYDNLLYDCGDLGIYMKYGTIYCYNCTVLGASNGYSINNSYIDSAIAKNCLAQDCTDGFYGSFDSASDYNCSDISSDAPGTNSVTGTVTFVDAPNDDYHLASSDTVAKDAGTDLSSDANLPIWRDIDGEDRVAAGTWDIGADEYVAAGTTITLIKMSQDWQGQDIKLNMNITTPAFGMSWTGKSAKANLAIILAKMTQSWVGKALYANKLITLAKTAITWTGKNILLEKIIHPAKMALSWAGKTITINGGALGRRFLGLYRRIIGDLIR